jgi:hypothetical protein
MKALLVRADPIEAVRAAVRISPFSSLLICNIKTLRRVLIFWDITPCSPLKVNRRFGRTYDLHLQNRVSRAQYLPESRWQVGGDMLLRNVG